MLNSFFLNKTGMLIQQRRLEIASNNLANLNTVGFKKDKIFFHKLTEALAESDEIDENRLPGASHIDFSGGSVKKTDNPLDVALAREGFFAVQGEAGEYYTRSGSFRLNSEGTLVTPDGYSVLTDGGELQISGNEMRFNEKGEIIVDGQSVGRLKIVNFENPELLDRVGNAYFRAGDVDPEDVPEAEIDMRPGYLEISNVDPILEMVAMIEIGREYELGQKAIQTQDRTLDKLINQAGKL